MRNILYNKYTRVGVFYECKLKHASANMGEGGAMQLSHTADSSSTQILTAANDNANDNAANDNEDRVLAAAFKSLHLESTHNNVNTKAMIFCLNHYLNYHAPFLLPGSHKLWSKISYLI